MAYDPENPPSLITQGIGGPVGMRWYALVWVDPIADVLVPGYISNAELIGMRPGDGLVYKDVNRGEWDAYHLIVLSIDDDGLATVAFPEVPEEALPLETEFGPDLSMTQLVAYKGGRQVRGRLNDLVEFSESEYKSFAVGGAVQQVDLGTDFPVPIVYINNQWQSPSTWTLQNGQLQSNGGVWPSGTLTAWVGGTRTFVTALPLIYSTDIVNFTEAVQDAVGATLVAGANVSIVYNDIANQIIISATGGGGGGGGVSDHGELDGLGDDDHTQYHNDARGDLRYYTKGQVDALIDAVEGGGGGGTPTATKYPVGTISGQTIDIDSAFPFPILTIGGVPQSPDTYTLSGGIITSISGDWPIGEKYAVWVGGNETFVATNPLPPAASDVQGLQEAVEDFLNNSLLPGTGITKSYNDTTGKLTIAATPMPYNETLNPLQFGAVGNNDPANAAADTAGVIAAMTALASDPTRPATLDLLGRKYFVNDRLKIAAGGDFHHKRITNGRVSLGGGFPAGTPVLDLSNRNSYATKLDHLFIDGHKDGLPFMKEGILLGQNQEFRIDRCDIEGFAGVVGNSGAGIRDLFTNFGQQLYITNCQVAARFGDAQTQTIGIDIWGGDTNIIDCTVRECETLVLLRKGAHTIRGGHYYYYSHPIGPGIVIWSASHVLIDSAYIDSCGITLEGYDAVSGAGTRFISACAFNNNRFLTHPDRDMPSGFAFVTMKPRAANMVVHGLTINNNAFQRNRSGQPDPWPVRVLGTNGGSVGADTWYQAHMVDNAFDGVKQQTTRPRKEQTGTNVQQFTCNFTNEIPWGRIQRTLSATLQAAVGTPGWAVGPVDKNNNNITIFTSAALTGRAVIVADTSNDAL